MPKCDSCGGDFGILELRRGRCAKCRERLTDELRAALPAASEPRVMPDVLVTTEAVIHDKVIERRLGIVSSEAVIGINVFKDILAGARDIFGGRSRAMQDELRKARASVIAEIQAEASSLGANAVIAVDLDYSEVGGGGPNMLLLAANGTAVLMRDRD